MKTFIFVSTLLISNLCFANELTTRNSWPNFLCTTYPKDYICITIPKKSKTKTIKWNELFSDELFTEVLKKVNRRNTNIRPKDVIAIPLELYLDTDLLDPTLLTLMTTYIETEHTKVVIVDPQLLQYSAYQDGSLIKWGIVNIGSKICSDTKLNKCKTPVGNFNIITKKGKFSRSNLYPTDCKDKKKCGAKLYYSMIFHNSGASLHGHDTLPGYNASHGCIRLLREDAAWLYQFINKETKIVIKDY